MAGLHFTLRNTACVTASFDARQKPPLRRFPGTRRCLLLPVSGARSCKPNGYRLARCSQRAAFGNRLFHKYNYAGFVSMLTGRDHAETKHRHKTHAQTHRTHKHAHVLGAQSSSTLRRTSPDATRRRHEEGTFCRRGQSSTRRALHTQSVQQSPASWASPHKVQ